MTDEKQSDWFITLDEVLKYSTEEVLAMFVHDCRNVFATISVASDLLSNPKLNREDDDNLIKVIQKNATRGHAGLDLMLDYLKARQAIKNTDNQPSE